jgi:NDP-sugar pyrophosphorylase family protein
VGTVDVRAIIMLAPPTNGDASSGLFAGVPLVLMDVLGRPVLDRVVERLKTAGIADVSVICRSEPHAFARSAAGRQLKWVYPETAQYWRSAENAFNDAVHAGAELVVAMRLGPYAEIDFDELLQFHIEQGARITSSVDNKGESLDALVINGSRRNDAAYLFRNGLQRFRTPPVTYSYCGYVNRLNDVFDLRRLATDGLMQRAQVVPAGREIKPGVWAADSARIHRGARVLAPAFIGPQVKLRAAAVVTRCSALESHSEVDCGTVVEDATILPYTYVGAGLDVGHAVVGFRRLAHLRKKVEVEITDPKLVNMISLSAPVRAAGSAASLLTFLPLQMIRGFFGRTECEPEVREAIRTPSAALTPEPVVFSAKQPAKPVKLGADLVVVRKYGSE